MANRNLDFSPNVTSVVAENPTPNPVLSSLLDVADTVAKQSAQTKALQATADTQVKFRALDSQFRQDYADNPTDPEGLRKLQEARQQVIDEAGQNVPSITMREYTNKAIELTQQSDASNQLWTTKQQVRNTVNNMQTARVSYLNEANASGRNFAQSDEVDLSSALNYLQANQSIQHFANPVLGADKTAAFLKTFNTDYVKSFVTGVAEINPQRAAQLLEDGNIKDHFTTQERGDMADLIKRTQRQQELIQTLQTAKTMGDVTGIVNDPDATYFEKRAKIDQLDMEGSITPKAAASARRVIKSAEDLETQTDTPVMADIIHRVYDLNENTSLKQSEYLNGVKSVQEMILEKQAANQLSSHDAIKLTKEIQQLTQKRVADATKSVGYSFGEANKKFDSLPPEYRGEATRQLFYTSFGQNMTKAQLSGQADVIIDQINKKRRSEALSIISKTTNDDVFLQATGYSRADVAATAQKRGISQDQVIQALRSKYATKRKTLGPVKGAAMGGDEAGSTPSPGIQLDGNAPDVTDLTDEGDQ